MHRHQRQWDQAAWNEVLVGFVMGMGNDPPLRFRLLPVEQYANIGEQYANRGEGLGTLWSKYTLTIR